MVESILMWFEHVPDRHVDVIIYEEWLKWKIVKSKETHEDLEKLKEYF